MHKDHVASVLIGRIMSTWHISEGAIDLTATSRTIAKRLHDSRN